MFVFSVGGIYDVEVERVRGYYFPLRRNSDAPFGTVARRY